MLLFFAELPNSRIWAWCAGLCRCSHRISSSIGLHDNTAPSNWLSRFGHSGSIKTRTCISHGRTNCFHAFSRLNALRYGLRHCFPMWSLWRLVDGLIARHVAAWWRLRMRVEGYRESHHGKKKRRSNVVHFISMALVRLSRQAMPFCGLNDKAVARSL